MKLILTCVLCLLLPLAVLGQYEEKFYPSGELMSKGKYKTSRTKTAFGYDIVKLKTGEWEYYYSDGTLALKEEYKAGKKSSTAKGVWEYYATEGQLMKKEYYKNGDLDKVEFYNEGLFNFSSDSLIIRALSSDTLLVTKYLHGDPFSEIAVKSSEGFFVYPKKGKNGAASYQVPALADDGFRLEDTGRNLIGNFSFEVDKNEGFFGNEIIGVADTFMHHWYVASGTPDYFRNMGRSARTGERFCGIRIFSQIEYLEYLENQMKDTLQKGHKYCCRVHFRLNPASGMATDAIGFRFDKKLLKFYYHTDALPVPDIINTPGQTLTEKGKWMQLTGLYVAQGGERYFTIGGFRALGAQNAVTLNEDKNKKKEAYYVIDDAFVWEIEDESECPCNAYTVPDSLKPKEEKIITKREDTTTYEVGKTFIIKNIFFDTDKAELLPKSFAAIDSLVEILYSHPEMEIEISGHTDNTGTEERNRVLSMERAQAVVDYLISYGINQERLTYEGYAADQPIDTNNTPEGRQNNRRVQFKILKM